MSEMESVSNKNILKVGIYLRLSDEDKNKINKSDDSESIKNQRNLLVTEIKKHDNFVYVDEYCDEDLSGAGTFRPEFERLISDCKEGKLDIVMCKSQSRFSRDMEIIEKYLHNKFIEWGVRFISLSDNADTFNKGNKKSRQINGLVNEWFLEDVSNNIRTAFNAKMKNGEYISPFAPFGYIVSKENNNKLIVDKYASLIVKRLFNLYVDGYGYGSIAKKLNEDNIPSPSLYKKEQGHKLNVISKRNIEDIKWSSNAIKTILTNEIYLGHLIQGKRSTVSYKNKKIIKKNKDSWIVSKNTHEPIISEALFNKVKILMKERTRVSNKSNKTHIFSGKVFCLECDSYLKRNCTSKHEYLVCTSNRDGYNECVNKLSMRYDVLYDIVLNAINAKINNYYNEEKLTCASKDIKEYDHDDENLSLRYRLEELEKKLNITNNYLKTLYQDKVNQVINDEQFKLLMEDYSNNEKIIKNEINSINETLEYKSAKQKSRLDKKEIFSKYKVLSKLEHVIINEFIDKIYIGKVKDDKSRDIKIIWNIE
ncbi:MAG: recombinase family protein [bacterium]